MLTLIDVEEIEEDIVESEFVSDKIAQMRSEIEDFLSKPSAADCNRETTEELPHVSRPYTPIINTTSVNTPLVNNEVVFSSASVGNHSLLEGASVLGTRVASTRPKLPKLHLPKFTGDVTKFRTFWDSYESAIHRNPELSPIDKFNYLRALLDGPAASAIQGLNLSDANYTAAVELIKERYGKTQQTISALMDDLLKIPNCMGDKTSQLRAVYDKIGVNVRGLEALGITADRYGSFLIPIIMSKLPSEVHLQIARVSTRDVWDVNELLHVIKSEVEAREISDAVKVQDRRGHEAVSKRTVFPPTAAALVTRDSSHQIQCVYCKANHYSAACDKVKNCKSRRDILLKEGRCFLCLSIGHRASQCSTSRRCRQCNRRHHQSICEPPSLTESTPNSNQKDNTDNTTTSVSRTKAKVLLQTARGQAYDTNGELLPVRLLLDSGSQRSYITNRLVQRLQLKPIRRERLNLNTFGNEQFNKRRCDLVNVKLQVKRGEEIEISALSFPAICSPLQVPVEVDKYPHLQDLDLADACSSEQSSDVDMLIGSDYYWDVIIGDLKRGGNGPVAVSSKFGSLLSGPMKSKRGEDGYTVTNLAIEGLRKVELISEQHTDEHDSELDKDLRLFWDTEAIGIMEEAESISSQQCFVDLKFDWTQGRYQVSLPWKTDYRPQNNGYEMCIARFNQLRTKLQRDKSLFQEYHSVLMAQLQDGIIELVPNSMDVSYSHFLPHHGIRKRDRQTTKLRIVFDASAKINQTSRSLNDCLEKRPNGIPHLFDILLKF